MGPGHLSALGSPSKLPPTTVSPAEGSWERGGEERGGEGFWNWFWQLLKPIRAQRHFGVGPSRGLASPGRRAHLDRSPSPCPHAEEAEGCWALGGDQSAVSPSGRQYRCPLLSAPPEWKGQASGTGNWVLPGPGCLLFFRLLESARPAAALPASSVGLAPGGPSLQLPQSELGTKAWPAHIPTSITCPSQSWRTQGRTGALRTCSSLRLAPASSHQLEGQRSSQGAIPQPQTAKVPGIPLPILAEMI